MSTFRSLLLRRFLAASTRTLALLLLTLSLCCAQKPAPGQQLDTPWAQDLKNYPQLPDEISHLMTRLQKEVTFPDPRTESRLLPVLPQSSLSYIAIPNYGEATSQVVKVFRQELQDSAVLREWWAHGQMAANGPKVLDSLEKFAQLHQFLGDELVLAASMTGKEPDFVLVAEIRKPGLKKFLQLTTEQLAGKAQPQVRVLEPQELATAKDKTPTQQILVLVRPDFAVAAADLATLRGFNTRLDATTREFPSTPFGQRVHKEYQDGVTVLAALDVQKILEKFSPASTQSPVFRQSGFADMQYLVWDHKTLSGKDVSQMELSFGSPRREAAAWLAKPAPLGSLDFVSPKALMAGTLLLSNPAQIFDGAKELAALSHSNAFAAIPAVEQAMNLSLKDDFLSLLGGEVTFELDGVAPAKPAWRTILAVKDADHLQQTLGGIIAKTHFEASQQEEGGITYYSFRIPSQKDPTDVAYAFADGYMIVGSSRDAVAEAVRLHKSADSLAKYRKFLNALPPGHGLEASAMFYEDPRAMTGLSLRSISPELAGALAKSPGDAPPAVISIYGEDSAIREISPSSGFDVAGVLVVAAIAIPNLLRARMAANESSAVGSVRSINTGQVEYRVLFPKRGFAPNLASLGLNASAPDAAPTSSHAGLLDSSLANPSCLAAAWCTKSGYNFKLKAICELQHCTDYLVIATPVSENTGTRSFCSTSDGLIRSKVGAPLTAPLTFSQCKTWRPLE